MMNILVAIAVHIESPILISSLCMAVQDHQQLLRFPLPNAASCQQMMLIIIWVIDWLCPIRVSWAPITLPRASQQQRFPQSPDSPLDVDNIIMCPYWTVYRSCSCGSGVVVAWVAWMNSFHSSNKPLIAFPTHLCRSYFIALSEGRPAPPQWITAAR